MDEGWASALSPFSAMRDADVRAALHAKVLADHHGDADTLVLDEFDLWYGAARIDIAVVNGRMHGFEIKSERDTLERLDGQMAVYNLVLDRVTIVVAAKHLEEVIRRVPNWWGIKVALAGKRGAVHFEERRAPRTNPAVDPVAVASLLWCDELTEILVSLDAARGVRGKARHVLCQRLATTMPITDLRAEVRRRLRARGTWRAGA